MRSSVLAIAFLLFAPVTLADAYDSYTPGQDSFIVQYGYACDAECSFGAAWYLSETSQPTCCTVLEILGYAVYIPANDIVAPVGGLPFSNTTTIDEVFNLNPTCDATTNELVCDEMTLGIFTDGAVPIAGNLPFDNAVQAEYNALTEPPIATPEPDMRWLIGLEFLVVGLGCCLAGFKKIWKQRKWTL